MSLLGLPTQLFSYLGEFLDLKDIRALALTNKSINQKIEKEKIYLHYLKNRFGINTLPKEFKSWKELAKQMIKVEWENFSKSFKFSEDKKKVESASGTWGCALTNLYFIKGRHLITFLVEKYSLGFFGIALENTPLEEPCFGKNCFGYSPFYKSYR
jgi:hypothetical protein